jgi:PrcB C-terminal
MTPHRRNSSRRVPVREHMKAAVLFILISTASTCSAPSGGTTAGTTGGPVELRTLQTGGYPAATPRQHEAHLAADEKTYRELWRSLIGDNPPPAADFAKESVVFLFAGQRSTGGHSIEVRGASVEQTTLVVDAEIKGPPPGSMVTQALTSPFAVIAVSTKNAKDVRWEP